MRFAKLLLTFLTLLLIPALASGQQCYSVGGMNVLTDPNIYDASFLFTGLSSTSCSSTPSGKGWRRIHSAPYELHLAVPYSLDLDGCHLPFYFGESGGKPVVPLWLVLGTACENEPFSLSSTPPACSALYNVSISGPSSTFLYHSHPFTANVSGGQGPYTYSWSIRHHHHQYGWSYWSTFNGTQTTTASSSSCGYDKYELKVEVTESSCGLSRMSSTVTVTVTNFGCPW